MAELEDGVKKPMPSFLGKKPAQDKEPTAESQPKVEKPPVAKEQAVSEPEVEQTPVVEEVLEPEVEQPPMAKEEPVVEEEPVVKEEPVEEKPVIKEKSEAEAPAVPIRRVPSFVSAGSSTSSESSPSESSTDGLASMDRKIEKKVWTPKRIASIGAVATFVGLVVYMALFGDHSAKLNVQVERITISDVTRGPFQEFIVQRGTVLPIQTVYIDALEGGQIEEIYLEEGTIVKKDQPILRLSNPRLEQSVLNQEATLFEQINNMENTRLNLASQAIRNRQELMRVELSLQQTEREYNKMKALFESGLESRANFEIAEEKYDNSKKLRTFFLETVRQDSLFRMNQLASLDTRAGSLQRQLDDVRRPLENLIVRAPIDGQLSQLNAEIGQLMGQGTDIGKVDRLDGFKMTAGVDEFYITKITTGLKGTIEIDDEIFELKIRRVFPEVVDGQFEVDLDFVGKLPESIRRGQTEQIRLELDDPEEALLLARGGFYQTTGGNWVFVVEGDQAVRRDVRIGRQNPEFFEVLSGLVPGERVVTSSYENYEEIDKLILQQ